jgi:thiamine-phosphate pyrophosphorylase
MLPSPPLLLVTDRRQASAPLEDVVSAALDGGCRWLMLREKDLDPDERQALARRLLRLCQGHAASLLVNSDVEAAAAVGAQGVHLPAGGSVQDARSRLGGTALIGVSAHDAGELRRAEAEGADYATLSPVFRSPSKPTHGPALGLEGLRRLAAGCRIPILALGGVAPGRVRGCLDSGARGVAVMGAVMAAQDPASLTRCLIAELLGIEGRESGYYKKAVDSPGGTS